MNTTCRFPLGNTVVTAAIARTMEDEPAFTEFVKRSFARFIRADWGEMDPDDMQMNDEALETGDDRLFGSYNCDARPDWKIWIITEWDHSATTVLFPDDY